MFGNFEHSSVAATDWTGRLTGRLTPAIHTEAEQCLLGPALRNREGGEELKGGERELVTVEG